MKWQYRLVLVGMSNLAGVGELYLVLLNELLAIYCCYIHCSITLLPLIIIVILPVLFLYRYLPAVCIMMNNKLKY